MDWILVYCCDPSSATVLVTLNNRQGSMAMIEKTNIFIDSP
ncbi:MAG: hypothetical protein WC179_05740 [Candidatus Cloacimonadaceae bacterium]